MDKFASIVTASITFSIFGAPDAERVLVIMGSGAETAIETIENLVEKGEKIAL